MSAGGDARRVLAALRQVHADVLADQGPACMVCGETQRACGCLRAIELVAERAGITLGTEVPA